MEIQYGSGAIKGFFSKDNLDINGLKVEGVDFGEVSTLSWNFLTARMDGILGMGFRSISIKNYPTVFDKVVEKGETDASFAFYLTSEPGAKGSELTIGGVDESHYTGNFKYVPLASETYWLVKGDKIELGDDTIATDNLKFIVDSGTSAIVGDKDLFAPVIAKIPQEIDCNKLNELPSIFFTMGGVKYEISPEVYVLKVSALGQTQCMSGLMTMDFSKSSIGAGAVILGDVFMLSLIHI